jgi:flagellar protein FlbD
VTDVISLTRFSGQRFALNPDLIERIEATPDTVITMVDGNRQVVREDLDEVVARVQHHRATILAMSQQIQVVAPRKPAGDAGIGSSPALRLISKQSGED